MNEFLNVGALVVAAALNDDTEAVRVLLHSLPPEQIAAAAEASVLAMAILIRDHLPAHVVQVAINGAQQIAHETATEGAQS